MRTFMLAAALIGATLFAAPASAQPAYTLQCRGGGNMNVNIAGQASGGGTEIVVGYQRATVTTALPAGTCAWLDRPLNSREPQAFQMVVRARMNVDYRPRPGDTVGDHAGAFVYAGSGPDVALAQSIVDTLKAGGTFEVSAYNPGRGFMIATNFHTAPAH